MNDMKRIPFTLVATSLFAMTILVACGGGSDDPGLDALAVEQTQQALAVAADAGNQTATADALAQAAANAEASSSDELPTPTPLVAAVSELDMTLAAAGTLAAPTIAAGQTLAAQTQAAQPTLPPLILEVITTTINETITENEVEITVTAIVPPSITIAQAWSQVYSAPVGLTFTITADEESMTSTVENTIASAGFADNVDDVSVRLNNGLILVNFSVVFGASAADGDISFSVFAADGQMSITIVHVGGQLTLPQELLDAFNVAIAHALTGSANTNQAQVTINDVSINDGRMIVTGTVGTP